MTEDLEHTISAVKKELENAIRFQPQNTKITKDKILQEFVEFCSPLSPF